MRSRVLGASAERLCRKGGVGKNVEERMWRKGFVGFSEEQGLGCKCREAV